MVDVFKALADPTRRHLLDRLRARDGQTLTELTGEVSMARQSVSKHLGILEDADLISTVWRGREKLHYLNAVPINEIAERWIRSFDRPRVAALADLKRTLEVEPVERPTFVYVTYIRTTPERLWQALTDPGFTARWWNTTFETDWQPGSPLTWVVDGVRIEDPEQRVLEADPPRRLSYNWHTFSPEYRAQSPMDPELLAKVAAEHRSRVTFDLEPLGEAVRLTVTHDDFAVGSTAATLVRSGWPRYLSGLKTLLETGEPFPSI